jgi:hypothetical protein
MNTESSPTKTCIGNGTNDVAFHYCDKQSIDLRGGVDPDMQFAVVRVVRRPSPPFLCFLFLRDATTTHALHCPSSHSLLECPSIFLLK